MALNPIGVEKLRTEKEAKEKVSAEKMKQAIVKHIVEAMVGETKTISTT
jgi:hypothetical protein